MAALGCLKKILFPAQSSALNTSTQQARGGSAAGSREDSRVAKRVSTHVGANCQGDSAQGRILLKEELLELVGGQEDGVCQHEVIQEYFCKREEREREFSINNRMTQRYRRVKTMDCLMIEKVRM